MVDLCDRVILHACQLALPKQAPRGRGHFDSTK